MAKNLTKADILDRFAAMIRERGRQLGYGSFVLDCTFEVHDGQIKSIEHSERKRREKMRIS